MNFEPADGLGISPTQYTTDMSVNPSTYTSVAEVINISQPHGIGYVWNTMLWEAPTRATSGAGSPSAASA